jgi:hypothetical protein
MSEGSPTPRPRWFQFTTRGILVATFWVAVFSSGLGLFNRLWKHELVALESEDSAYLVIGCLLFVSIPAAIGGLFGRALWGAGAGIILYLLYVGWIMFALNTWGDT